MRTGSGSEIDPALSHVGCWEFLSNHSRCRDQRMSLGSTVPVTRARVSSSCRWKSSSVMNRGVRLAGVLVVPIAAGGHGAGVVATRKPFLGEMSQSKVVGG